MEKISRKGFLKVAAAAAMSGVTTGALAACNSAASSSTAATGDAIYTAGTYTGTATGIGEVKVTMTFSETAITEVVIDASNETESIGGVAAPTLQEAIMAAQGTEIDNISGATVTTNAVKKAAASCIEQAMGVKADGADSSAAASENDWLGTEPEIDESKVTKTVDVDVAVVGCGVAGVAAVRSIAEDGGNISQGQKQLLCIARVMLCLPPMLILDEATSSIDTRTEVRIQKAFARMMQGRTSFIVAHRLSTIRDADVILVMDKGDVVEAGTHEELLKNNAIYQEVYSSQTQGGGDFDEKEGA